MADDEDFNKSFVSGMRWTDERVNGSGRWRAPPADVATENAAKAYEAFTVNSNSKKGTFAILILTMMG